MTLRALTKRTGSGALYTRTEVVEQQIRSALVMTPDALLQRLRVSDSDTQAPDYIQEEALVYLIQDAFATGQEGLANDLWTVLLKRCAAFLYAKFRSLGTETAKDAQQVAVEKLLVAIIDLEHGRGDFYQVRFWLGLKKLAITTFETYHDAAEREVPASSLVREDAEEDADGSEALDEDHLILGHTRFVSPEDHAMISDALAHIPPHCRDAFVLRHYHNWQIESKDPAEPSISEALGKTPRTIRNWLKTAEEAVASWRGARP